MIWLTPRGTSSDPQEDNLEVSFPDTETVLVRTSVNTPETLEISIEAWNRFVRAVKNDQYGIRVMDDDERFKYEDA